MAKKRHVASMIKHGRNYRRSIQGKRMLSFHQKAHCCYSCWRYWNNACKKTKPYSMCGRADMSCDTCGTERIQWCSDYTERPILVREQTDDVEGIIAILGESNFK